MMLHLDKYTRVTPQDEYTSSICQIDEYLDVKMCSCDSTKVGNLKYKYLSSYITTTRVTTKLNEIETNL